MRDVPWKLRAATREDRTGILDLHGVVFGDEDPDKHRADFWDWEFQDDPHGVASISVAQDGAEVVGHYACVPLPYLVDGTVEKGAIVVDVMTHPRYRNQGMFTAIGRFALAQAREQGIRFTVGYPVRPEVMPGHMKVGWKKIFSIPVIALPLDAAGVVGDIVPALRGPAKALGPIVNRIHPALFRPLHRRAPRGTIVALDRADERIDRLWAATKASSRVIGVRSAQHVAWRYFDRRSRDYKVLGFEREGELLAYLVLRKTEIKKVPTTSFVDFLARPDAGEAFALLVREGLAIARRDRSHLAAAMLTPGNLPDEILRGAGFVPTPFEFWFIVYYQGPEADRLRPFTRGEDWFLTWGDTDVM